MPEHIAGEKFVPSASRERELDRLLRDARAGRTGLESPNGATLQPGHVLAKNDTGSDLGFGKGAMILGLGGAYVTTEPTPRRDWRYQKGYYTLKVLRNIISDPASEYPSALAITVEPIKSGEIGIVAIAGLAICSDALGGTGYVRPNGTSLVGGSNWGLARIVTQESGSGFSIVNLDDQNWWAVYQLTASLASSPNAKIDPGATEYTTRVYDDQSIASWQVSGDKGLAVYDGVRWEIRVPWCVA